MQADGFKIVFRRLEEGAVRRFATSALTLPQSGAASLLFSSTTSVSRISPKDSREKVTEAVFIMVAVDENGEPRPVRKDV